MTFDRTRPVDRDGTINLSELDRLSEQAARALGVQGLHGSGYGYVSASGSISVPADLSVASTVDIDTATAGGRLNPSLLSSGYYPGDNSSGATLYYLPYSSGKIALYTETDGWGLYSFYGPEASDYPSTSGENENSTNYDIYAYWDEDSETVELEQVAWFNDLQRLTSPVLDYANGGGVLVKTDDVTRRYLGTARTNASGLFLNLYYSRYVCNFYNRIPLRFGAVLNEESWSYSSDTWRAANNDTTTGQTRCDYVASFSGQHHISLDLAVTGTDADTARVGIDIDSESDFGPLANVLYTGRSSAYYANLNDPAVQGYHFFQWVERGDPGGVTFYGSAGASDVSSGMWGTILM